MSVTDDMDDQDIFCNLSIANDLIPVLKVFSSFGTVSTAVCLLAVVLLIFLRLYKNLTNRMILYLLLAVLFFSASIMIQFIAVHLNYWKGERYSGCIAKGFLLEYSIWVMLLSTTVVTCHLAGNTFFPSKYDKFLTRYIRPHIIAEVVIYGSLPWIVPLLFIWIPFINSNYGVSGPWCWLRVYEEDCSLNEGAVIEVFALWYAGLMIILIVVTVTLAIVIVTLCKRGREELKQEPRDPEGDGGRESKHNKSLLQILILMGYPIMYLILGWLALANRINQAAIGGRYVKWTFYVHAVAAPSWGFFAGLFTIVYIIAAGKFRKSYIKKVARKWLRMRKKTIDHKTKRLEDPNDRLEMAAIQASDVAETRYSVKCESIADDDGV